MKNFIIGLVIFFWLAVVTNPSIEKHKEAVKRSVVIEVNTDNEELISPTIKIKKREIRSHVQRENNFIYSETYLKTPTDRIHVGYGFFGFVIINQAIFTTVP